MTTLETDIARQKTGSETLTLTLILATYAAWGALVFGLSLLSPALAAMALAPVIAFHSSLSHEAIHGHPFRSQRLNDALMLPALILFVPYLRFKQTHLDHHRDEHLTDPYDDPETNYLALHTWQGLGRPLQWVLRANNTLLGRMVLGPAIGIIMFSISDLRRARRDRRVLLHWLGHCCVVAVLTTLIAASTLPLWAYLLAAYGAMSLLKIRTFLEHRAHDLARARTVVVEDRGPLAFLFLNNNLHVVHHMHPKVPWYDLPQTYTRNRDHYLRRNEGYAYASYADVFRRHFVAPKDPVAHPLWQKARDTD